MDVEFRDTGAATMPRRRKCMLFCAWIALFSALWLFAGAPIDTYGGGDRPAGFPLRFMVWNGGALREFNGWCLVLDVVIGMVTVAAVSWMCATSAAARRPISNYPGDSAQIAAALMFLLLLFAPVYFSLVDYNRGYLGRLAGLYPDAKPVQQIDPRFPIKKE